MENSENTSKRLKQSRFTSKLLLVAAAICAVTLGSTLTASADNPFPPIGLTESGLVIGSATNGANQFLGIPYAAPPVGALRWTPPKPYGFFPGLLLNATSFGSECTQASGGSENCLFLNVYTPQNVLVEDLTQDQGRGLPVMVWIHGGSLTYGAASIYNPSFQLVQKGVIVVTINYRLGLLGFFAQSAIDAEGHENGNYGLMDQQFALNWVRRNIAGFGGDPNRVTIFGESAGGQSVYAHLASPKAAGLFRGAIAESGSYLEFQNYYSYIVPLATAETAGSQGAPSGTAVADSVGCTSQTAACLRAVPAASLVAVQSGTLYPFVDGTLLPQQISAAFASGEFNRVPVISGGNHDEWRLQVAENYDFVGNPILTAPEYDTAVLALWGSAVDSAVLALYPFGNYEYGGEALGASGTDGIYACPERNGIKLLSQFVPTYAYEFNDDNALYPIPAGETLSFPLGAFHSAELQYLFPLGPSPAAQVPVSDEMVTYWTQFAKNLNPNSPLEPVWSPYSASTDEFQSLISPTPVVESNFNTFHQCDSFWNNPPPP